MTVKKITAIIDELQLTAVGTALESRGVMGFTVHPVQGRGDYCNTYSRNQLVNHVQIEIYTSGKYAHRIAKLIIQTADVGAQSEGLVAITAVDQLYWICGGDTAAANEFKYYEVMHG